MFPTHRVHVDAAHWVAVGQPDNGNGEGGTGGKKKQKKPRQCVRRRRFCYCITQAFSFSSPGCPCAEERPLFSFIYLFSLSSDRGGRRRAELRGSPLHRRTCTCRCGEGPLVSPPWYGWRKAGGGGGWVDYNIFSLQRNQRKKEISGFNGLKKDPL